MAEAGALFNKFQQLWQAGKNARLNIECHSGQAWVSLHVHLPHPPHPPTVYHQHPRQHGPSRLLRRARREAARRTTTAEQAVVESSVVAEPLGTTKTMQDIDIAEEAIKDKSAIENNEKESTEDLNLSNAENAYSCDFCERTFSTENGLKSHEGKMHKATCLSPIPQIDGLEEENQFVKYAFKSEYGEEDIEDSLNKVKEKTNVCVELLSRVRTTALSAVHDCVVRVFPVQPDSFMWPELEAEDAVVFVQLVKLQ